MKLNLGCGFDKKEGFTNIDITKDVNPDVVWDLTKTPYPFKNNSITQIYAKDVLEHIPRDKLLIVLEEWYRISKPNAIWEIIVPFYNTRLANANILHFGGFDFTSFDFLEENKSLESSYTPIKIKVISVKGIPTFRGKFIPFKMFLRHSIGEIFNILKFKIKVIKK
jgi:hypothetical protein